MTDEKALVGKILQGDMLAFRHFIKRYERLVSHMIGRLVKNEAEREELCQDVFLKVYEKLREFNFQSKLSTWIATIAYRHSINALRKKRIMLTDVPDDEHVFENFVTTENPETIISDKDFDDYILTLIDQLPHQYKIVLTLFHVEGMHYHEIEAVTGMPEGTVKNYLYRARKLLKEKVKKYIREEEWL